MPRSLFLISTVSQAFFLSHVPQLVTNESVLILTITEKQQFKKIMGHLENLPWKRIFTWYIPHSSHQGSVFWRLIKIRINMQLLKTRFATFEKVYIGSYNNLLHLSILNDFESKKNVFLLYDGLQLVAVHALRKTAGKNNTRKLPKLYRILGFQLPEVAVLNYISPLPLEVGSGESITLIKNKLPYKEKFYDENLIYFIGQPLPLIGIVERTFYLETLRCVKNKYINYNFIYFPHPREDKETLDQVRNLMPVEELNTIFEEYFLNSSEFAGKIFSFYSSVLVNLVYLQAKADIYAIDIPMNKILSVSLRPKISSVYKYFRTNANNKFKVISVSPN